MGGVGVGGGVGGGGGGVSLLTFTIQSGLWNVWYA